MKKNGVPQQLSFEDIALRAIASELPKIETPVFRWRKLVRRLDPLGAKPGRAAFQAVAAALADYADRNGRKCRPSVETLCRDTGLGRRTVQYALRELVRWHVMAVERPGNGRKSTEYLLLCPGEKAVDKPGEKSGVHDAKGARGDTGKVHPRAPQVRQRERSAEPPVVEPAEFDVESEFAQLALRVVPGLLEAAG